MSWNDVELEGIDRGSPLTATEPVLIPPDVVYVPADSIESRDPADLEKRAHEFVASHPDLGPGTAVARVSTKAHQLELISSDDPADSVGMRPVEEGRRESPGVFLLVGEAAEKHNARLAQHEQRAVIANGYSPAASGPPVSSARSPDDVQPVVQQHRSQAAHRGR